MTASVKYNPGNIGDILKHSWLIEVVQQLSKIDPHSTFLYADTFCGFRDYPIAPFFIERLQHRFFDTPLYKIQEAYLQNGRYLGSVSIVKELIGDRLRTDVFDRNIDAMLSHEDGRTRLLELQSGYDILERMEGYDLILLDPYDDFLEEYKKVIRTISEKVAVSSVLLFVPYLEDKNFSDVQDFCKSVQVDFTSTALKTDDVDHDGKYGYGMIFFPAKKISHWQKKEIEKALRQITGVIHSIF